jgi:diguanylate cyclase (GGDEF)-like protein/PAS domain S-box-containing protein
MTAMSFMGPTPMPRERRLVVIVWLFVWIVVWLLAAAVYSIGVLAAGRAFVGAEGQWSRAQKEAVFHLSRYALERKEPEYQAFTRALAVPLALARARAELDRREPDEDRARAALLEARNHPGDIDSMISLYRRFHDIGPGARASALWSRAEAYIEALRDIGTELHARSAVPTPVALERIAAIDAALSPLEDQIAANLNTAQRAAQTILLVGLLLLAGLLLLVGVLSSKRFVLQNDRLQATLRESEAQTRRLIESAPLPLLILRSGSQDIVYANDRALQQFALDMDSVRERNLGEFQADGEAAAALSEALGRAGSLRDYELEMCDRNGRRFWMLLSAQRLRYAGEDCLLAALANIDDRKRLQEDMRRRAMHDPLTTLPNRAMFMEALERAVRKARRRSSRFSVLFVDLDRFKEVNDTLGHHAGDTLLQAVAERLLAAVRQSDLVARLGGDEFVVLIEEHRGPEEVMIVAQKVLSMLERPVLLEWREVSISASIGIASFPDDGEDNEALVKHADAAMYQAKERGRNNFQFYSEDMNAMTLKRYELDLRVRGALEREELFVQYLPEVDLASGRVIGVEALLRWREPRAGIILPAEFLPHAEETGTILAIGRWVLGRALSDLAAWRERGLNLALSLNLSARQLQERDLVNHLFRALQLHRIEPRFVRVEVTEATLLRDPAAAEHAARELRGLGVSLTLDDFGTGNAALGLVGRFPIEAVKIDRTLVAAAGKGGQAEATAQAVAALARALGLAVIAEGIETEEQRRWAVALGCTSAQGFLFARPLDADRVAALGRVRALT